MDLFEQIYLEKTPENMLINQYPNQGEFILTSTQNPHKGYENYIGYVVQIRLGVGEFGSDIYLLRHANGRLSEHENQFFYKLTKKQESHVRAQFKYLPEQEDFSLPYKNTQGIESVGFIIDKPLDYVSEQSVLALAMRVIK